MTACRISSGVARLDRYPLAPAETACMRFSVCSLAVTTSARVRDLCLEPLEDGNPAHVGQVHVDKHDVRLLGTRERQPLIPGARTADHLEPRVAREGVAQRAPHERMILDEENADVHDSRSA